MSDYIKREDAITQIVHDCKFCKKYALDRDGVRCEYCTVGKIHQIIRDMPNADVRPVVRGEWKQMADGACVCSVCQLGLESFTQAIFYSYCPNCGADMRGSANDNPNAD